ncbi:hypothetical protein GQ457_03G020260 [Hibiscus cannabinus]
MESAQGNPRVGGSKDVIAALTGVSNGRPPDVHQEIIVPTRLERLANPVCEEDQQIVKRSRGEGVEVMDVGVGDADGFTKDAAMDASIESLASDASGNHTSSKGGPPKPTFKDMLTGRCMESSYASAIPDLDVEIQEEDIKILYGALLNRIRTLWSPSGEIALIDLENGYYLVRFANEDDVSKVLMGGPWLIYGNYLTVQPWSRKFSTTQDHPDEIVLWVRLPGLSYRYYTKSMFRYIAGAVGKIIRIDYNNEEGKRGRFARLAVIVNLNKPLVPSMIIDGFCQRVEYEGLPTICYSCGRYGHIAEVCKREEVASKERQCTEVRSMASSSVEDRFGPWMQATSWKTRRASRSKDNVGAGLLNRAHEEKTSGKFDVLANLEQETETGHAMSDHLVVPDHHSSGLTDSGVVGGNQLGLDKEMGQVGSMVAHGEADDAVKVLLRGSSSESSRKGVVKDASGGKVDVASLDVFLPSLVTLKSNDHVVVRVVERGSEVIPRVATNRRLQSGAGISKPKGDMNKELHEHEVLRKESTLPPAAKNVDTDPSVQWRENNMFAESVAIDVVAVSNQYVHARCLDKQADRMFFITFVYASPNRSKQDEVWSQLTALRPNDNMAWVLGGDFNSIVSSDERIGGSRRRIGVSAKFDDFIQQSRLNDLGFHGPKFTWKRGVTFSRIGSDHRPVLLLTEQSVEPSRKASFKYLAAWQSNRGFEEMLTATWKPGEPIVNNISNFQVEASKWNRDSFGHIGRRKHVLLARIRGIERVNEYSPVLHLEELEDTLKRELIEVLQQVLE